MTTGATAPFFWIEIVVGLAIPFLILVFARNRQNMGLVTLASACVVVGVLCKRLWLLLTSFVEINLSGAPGIISGSTAARMGDGGTVWAVVSSYSPTWVEFVVVIGVISLGALAFIVLAQKLAGGRGAVAVDAAATSQPADSATSSATAA